MQPDRYSVAGVTGRMTAEGTTDRTGAADFSSTGDVGGGTGFTVGGWATPLTGVGLIGGGLAPSRVLPAGPDTAVFESGERHSTEVQ